MIETKLTRREAVAGLGASAALPLLSSTALASPSTSAQAKTAALLDSLAEDFLRVSPESATGLGIDTGRRAHLRYELSDHSTAGEHRFATILARDLARVRAVDTSKLDFQSRTNVEVVRSAYQTALEGFRFPYGDVSVGSYRNSPYVVIQNVGTYLDTPQLLENDQPIENRADAEAYLSRLSQYPRQLDGEAERMRHARSIGLVPPRFLADKTIPQLQISLKDARNGGALVDTLVQKTKAKGIAGDWARTGRCSRVLYRVPSRSVESRRRTHTRIISRR